MSSPCAKEPSYRLPQANAASLAIRPVAAEDAPWKLLHEAKTAGFALTRLGVGNMEWACSLSGEGLEMTLSGEGGVAMELPAFDFDGKENTSIKYDDKSLSVTHRGWTCRYRTDARILPTNAAVHNRNGRYKVFRAAGEKKIKVWVSIEKN